LGQPVFCLGLFRPVHEWALELIRAGKG
jgi:hypothetical protein